MSCAQITIVYGVAKTQAVAEKINEWEENNDERWFDGDLGLCGFNDLYSASDSYPPGFCGVELCDLTSYGQDLVSDYRFTPTEEEKKKAEASIAELDPELRALAGPVGVYFIWHDS